MKFFTSKYKYIVLTGVFFVALVVSMIFAQRKTSSESFEYSTMEDPKMPLVWAYMFDEKMNCMHGYTSDVGYDVTNETLTLLPENRRLKLSIENSRYYITGASYEIRNNELDQLMEKTDVETLNRMGSTIEVELPIQNLLTLGEEYRLDFILHTQDEGDIHYYSRIKYMEELELADQMIELAKDFSTRNFDYDDAREHNTMYAETDGTADNSTLAYTNLKSTFTNLAYGGMKLSPSAEKDIRISEYDGNTGEIHISMIASRETSSGIEHYQIEEIYTLRQGSIRIYMMNYARKMREIYDGNSHSLSSKRILLGINNDSDIETMTGTGGRYTYFVTTGDVWVMDSNSGELSTVFSFRSSNVSDLRTSYNRHDAQLLKCDELGNLYYSVYGYMNRGQHEGKNGVSFLKYDPESKVSQELFFVEEAREFDSIDYDMEELSYLAKNEIYYVKVGSNVYAIDTKAGSFLIIAKNLKPGTYSVNKGMNIIAWQEDDGEYGSEVINLMKLDVGIKEEIRAESGMLIKINGFIGNDIAISMCQKNDAWEINGVTRAIPAKVVEIMSDNLEVLRRYEKPNIYINRANVHDGRINMQLMEKTEGGSYREVGEDTLVSSEEAPVRLEGIGTFQNEEKLKVYYVILQDDVRGRQISKLNVAEVSYSGVAIEGIETEQEDLFEAYGDSELLGKYRKAADAINDAYEKMGKVKYHSMAVFNRAAIVTSRINNRPIEQAEYILSMKNNGELFDIRGIGIKPMLYFVSDKHYVLTYLKTGKPVIIYAYDKSIISCYDIGSGESRYLGMDEAEETFAAGGYDFMVLME